VLWKKTTKTIWCPLPRLTDTKPQLFQATQRSMPQEHVVYQPVYGHGPVNDHCPTKTVLTCKSAPLIRYLFTYLLVWVPTALTCQTNSNRGLDVRNFIKQQWFQKACNRSEYLRKQVSVYTIIPLLDMDTSSPEWKKWWVWASNQWSVCLFWGLS